MVSMVSMEVSKTLGSGSSPDTPAILNAIATDSRNCGVCITSRSFYGGQYSVRSS